ncbi:MAG: HD domain-containing phosphohydrolase [Oligoflexales bacterium]
MDGTSPKPLHALKQEQDEELISSFSELKRIFSSYEDFQNYTVSDDDTFSIELKQQNLVKIFISPEIFLNDLKIKPFLNRLSEDGTCLVCVGKTEELNQMPEGNHHAMTQQLGIPLTVTNLKICISTLHNLQSVLDKVHEEKNKVAEASEEVKYVLSISRELNGERDIPKLLNLILKKAREVTRADAGSIYTMDTPGDKKVSDGKLRFRFTQNDSISQDLTEFEIPINDKSVVGNAVIHEKTINIQDLYKLSPNPQDNPFGVTHDRSWDKRTGYESHSMLTTPVFDISHSVIGVIQLINCKKDKDKKLNSPEDFADQTKPFTDQQIEYAEIVAQQAGIALENAKMQDDIQNLFDSFVNASVTAIELRDPTTSGHSHRVAKLTLNLAEMVAKTHTGVFKHVSFNEDQMREIEYASLLHDFGKLGVREHVLVKAKKLYPDEFRLIEERFRLIRAGVEIKYLRNCLEFAKHPEKYPMGASPDTFLLERDKKFQELDTYFEFICKANQPTVLEQGGFELLRDIANSTFNDLFENDRPFLLSNELKALSVSRGSLTSEEFSEIQSHVTHTYEFLRKIPWGPKLMNVPQIAAKHHEKLDGSGYPTSAASGDIPIQSRMMTISDIYDALTASDRPYKKAMPYERALDIINMEVKGGKLDKDIYDIFLESKTYKVVL